MRQSNSFFKLRLLTVFEGNLPRRSVEASFAIELGGHSSPSDGPYLIRTTLADFSRLANATISILENFKRNKVMLIYEDEEYGNAILPYLTDALQNTGIQPSHKIAIPTYAEDFQILEGLELLKTLQNTMDPVAHDSITDVMGVRLYVPQTRALNNFKARYKRLFLKQNNVANELNLFALWVYDTYDLGISYVRGENWDYKFWLFEGDEGQNFSRRPDFQSRSKKNTRGSFEHEFSRD
ncbi:hypothetical protein PTKIN_Ptkin03bG0138000 [Pterospermum kingtungense]